MHYLIPGIAAFLLFSGCWTPNSVKNEQWAAGVAIAEGVIRYECYLAVPNKTKIMAPYALILDGRNPWFSEDNAGRITLDKGMRVAIRDVVRINSEAGKGYYAIGVVWREGVSYEFVYIVKNSVGEELNPVPWGYDLAK